MACAESLRQRARPSDVSVAAQYPALHEFLSHTDESYHIAVPFAEVKSALLHWYAANRRKLPWRGDLPPFTGSTAGINSKAPVGCALPPQLTQAPSTREQGNQVSPYGVWVSEIMCQQTRVEAVIPYWLSWMEAFPTVQALAEASEEEVNARWAGLGFYRRARMLHNGSKQVMEEFGGELPRTLEELRRLRGVGPYTAGAVASICFGIPAPVVDGNVLRVFSRLCGVAAHPQQAAFSAEGKLAWQLAQRLVEADGGSHPGDLNQAIMELGATLCAPGGTGSDLRDPLRTFYKSTKVGADVLRARRAGVLDDLLAAPGLGVFSCPVCAAGANAYLEGLRSTGFEDVDASQAHFLLPLPVPKKARREERLVVLALHRQRATPQGLAWLLSKRPDDGLLAGQWEFPNVLVAQHSGILPEDPGEEVRSAAGQKLLEELSARLKAEELVSRGALSEPLEHIFSHVRHTMHVEQALVPEKSDAASSSVGEQWDDGGRRLCWMGAEELAGVGVTAAVKKVMGAVSEHLKRSDLPVVRTPASRKRRAPAAESGLKRASAGERAALDVQGARRQPKLHAFFNRPLSVGVTENGCIDVDTDSGDA